HSHPTPRDGSLPVASAGSGLSQEPTGSPGACPSRCTPPQRQRPDTAGGDPLSGGLPDVGAGGGVEDLVAAAAQLGRGEFLVAGAGDRPLGPVVPPGAGPALGAVAPLVGVGPRLAADEVVRLGVPGRGHLGLDVAGGGEDEGGVAGEQLGGPVAAVPGGEM